MPAILKRYLILLLTAMLWLGLPSRGAPGAPLPAVLLRQTVALDNWDYTVDRDDHASLVTAPPVEPTHPQSLHLPLSWNRHPDTRGCTGAVWYAHDLRFPAQVSSAGGILTIESPIGLLDIFLGTQHLATLHGNGLTQQVPLVGQPGAVARLRIRLADSGRSEVMQRTCSCGLGAISVCWLPAVRIEALHTTVDLQRHLVIVRYRLAAETPGAASLRLELFGASEKRAIVHAVVNVTLTAKGMDGERTFTNVNLLAWTPRMNQTETHWTAQVYRLRAGLSLHGHEVDVAEMPCGACDIALNGVALYVGGKLTLLKGMRLPGGTPPVGEQTPRQVAETELSLISRAGFNAIMVDGAALSDDVLTVADQIGIMVVAEIPLSPVDTRENPAMTPAINETVTACGHHPCVVAWSWECPGTTEQAQRELKQLRAVDLARPALVRQGAQSQLVPPFDDNGIPFTDLDTLHAPASAPWEDILQQAEDDGNHHPMLISGVGIDLTAGGMDEQSVPVTETLNALRVMIEQIRRERQAPVLGYFIRLRHSGAYSGLGHLDGTPTIAFTTALACNAPCLLSLQAKSPLLINDTPEIEAALINDERLIGEYQLYQVLTSPNDHTAILSYEMRLNGDRIQGNLENLLSLPINQLGEYRLQLLLTQDNRLVAATQVIKITVKEQ